MAIAINPDVRELDFSDNVKVSKFMQDFSDFRAKKWITYRPVNAPSESEPFLGGTRQFIINMGTGHILDTTYSGLWFTLYFQNKSDYITWPILASLPRTSSAWIESVTFQHSKVAAHIDERLCDYDSASAIFTPAKEILSMRQTFFTTEGLRFCDNNLFNDMNADDPYGKMLPVGRFTTGRASFTTRSFFIPLCRLSSIFNSGKYFFPSLLRGNGEMTISIRSVAESLSQVFGGAGSSLSLYLGPNNYDKVWSTNANISLDWFVCMTNLNLVTLNLDNAFLTKEYNAFIASGRKFIRSFKGYNYQFYQVKAGYNRIEIANTHQSISHIILAFQAPYTVRYNGMSTDILNNQMLCGQKTTTGSVSSVSDSIEKQVVINTPANIADSGNTKVTFNTAPQNNAISSTNPVSTRLTRAGALDLGCSAVKGFVANGGGWVLSSMIEGATLSLSKKLPLCIQPLFAAAGGYLAGRVGALDTTEPPPAPAPLPLTDQNSNDLTNAQQKEVAFPGLPVIDKPEALLKLAADLGSVRASLEAAGVPVINNGEVGKVIGFIRSAQRETKPIYQLRRAKQIKLVNFDKLSATEKAYLVHIVNGSKNDDKVEAYLKSKSLDDTSAKEVMKILTTKKLKDLGLTADEEAQLPKMMSRAINEDGEDDNDDENSAFLKEAIARSLFTRDFDISDLNKEQIKEYLQKNHSFSDLLSVIDDIVNDERFTWHRHYNHMVPAEAKQQFDLGLNVIERLQVYRGTGNGETVFSEPINENMFYHVSREAMGDSAENHPYFSYEKFRKDMAVIVISLNTFMRDAHHEFWDGFSTNRVADRLYVEFEHIPLDISKISAIAPYYHDLGYFDNCDKLNCKVFTVYDNIYYIDRDNNLNVSDTLLPLQEGRIPGSD